MQGKILRVVDDRFFGFVLGEDGQEYFFHVSDLDFDAQGRFGELVSHQVEFTPLQTAKGLRARDIVVL